MTLLIPLGIGGVEYGWRIIAAILVLLTIVYFSYRQTIAAYPGGGGSYTVATENLGEKPGLLAAAALMIDYILTAAVGISAGVTALTSAVPTLQPHTLLICLVILALLAIVNLRGVKDTGTAFILPTFLFVSTLLTLIGVGMWKAVLAGGHPMPVAPIPPALPQTVGALGTWMLLKAFASGCAAMTGVEAVSNGVMAFGEPRVKRAQRTLTVIIGILMVLLFGIAYLAKLYRVMPMDPDGSGYQSLVSLLVTVVFGRGWFYYLTMGSVLLALALSANTAFADFPRLTRAIAMHDYLPHVFILRGRRLLYSHGIYALTGFTAVILILFGGVTDRLIPLYAIGAFLAFTLSQAGMVVHWMKWRRPQAARMAHVRQWLWGGVDRHHDDCGVGGEVPCGRLGHCAVGASADRNHADGEAALLQGEAGDGGHDAAERCKPGGADCCDSDGAVGPDHGEGDAVRSAAVEGD